MRFCGVFNYMPTPNQYFIMPLHAILCFGLFKNKKRGDKNKLNTCIFSVFHWHGIIIIVIIMVKL